MESIIKSSAGDVRGSRALQAGELEGFPTLLPGYLLFGIAHGTLTVRATSGVQIRHRSSAIACRYAMRVLNHICRAYLSSAPTPAIPPLEGEISLHVSGGQSSGRIGVIYPGKNYGAATLSGSRGIFNCSKL